MCARDEPVCTRVRPDFAASLSIQNVDVVRSCAIVEDPVCECHRLHAASQYRMGVAHGVHMGFDLDALIQLVVGLDSLARHFEKII